MSSFKQQHFAKTSFLYLPYKAREDGRLVPIIPSDCPSNDKQSCVIGVHGFKYRKCGPPFPLVQLNCRTHKLYFTVYPPGWVPFGRKSWASFKENGSIASECHGTYFTCILDMCKGLKWPEEAKGGSGTRKTQDRHIIAICELFSLNSESREAHHKTAESFQIDTLRVRDIANGIREGPTLLKKAGGVRAILSDLKTKMKQNLQAILQIGHTFGFWGTPLTENLW